MEPDAAKAEIERLLADDRRYGRRESAVAWCLIAIGIVVAGGAAAWVSQHPDGYPIVTWTAIALVAPAVLPLPLFRWAGARHHRAFLDRLLAIDDPVAVLEALAALTQEMRMSRDHGTIGAAKACLLLALSPADAQRLSPRWRRATLQILIDAPSVLHVPGARQRWQPIVGPYARLAGMIGDASHVKPLRHLAEVRPRNPEQEQIRLEAEKALSALLARLDAGGDRLLRPASGDADTLLRPAQAANTEELLRPAPGDDGAAR